MDIRVRTDRAPESAQAAREAERRVRHAMGGLARRVTAIAVRLFDVNGPRGGVDKVCAVTVSLARAGTVRYQAVSHSVAIAITEAVAGTRQAVARRVALRRDRRRRRSDRRPLAPRLA